MSGRAIAYAALLAALVVAPLPPLSLYPILVMKILCFALFACAFNLLVGYVGLLSFGHAMFFGGAAYVAGHAMKIWSFPPLLGIALGGLCAAALGFVVGSLAIRRAGIYFAMITLALAQMTYFFFLQAPFTGGEDGLQGIPRGSLLGFELSEDLNLYYVVLAICASGFALSHRIIHSPFGHALRAIRENEVRAISLGYDVARLKLLAFVLSAALAGIAGATKALVFRFATLTDVDWLTSGEVILMTLVGGMGSAFGPVVGAALIVSLQNELADKAGALVTVIMGAMFCGCVLAFRRGIVGEISAAYRRKVGR